MKEYQTRVIEEKRALDENRARLIGFMATADFDALPKDERRRMQKQDDVMRQYSEILGERIANFSA